MISTYRGSFAPSPTGPLHFVTPFGGWRIVKTIGLKITRLKPVSGFFAETGRAIVGVGAVQKLSAVRWGVAGNIVRA